MTSTTASSRARAAADRALLAPVEPYFQPIIDLRTNQVVGFESLARWPSVPEASPGVVFARAEELGLLRTLDWASRQAAIRDALANGITDPLSLFINVEPATLRESTSWEESARRLRALADMGLRVVLELTERHLFHDPGFVVQAAGWAHDLGAHLALDDVGSTPGSMALLPLVCPDIVKVDRSVLRDPMSTASQQILLRIQKHVLRTGAAILAEGIEFPDDLGTARAMGATYGQGFLLGRPTPNPDVPDIKSLSASADFAPIKAIHRLKDDYQSPTDLLIGRRTRTTTYRQLVTMFEQAAATGLNTTYPGYMLTAIQDEDEFTRQIQPYLPTLEEATHTLVGVVGANATLLDNMRSDGSTDYPPADHLALAIISDEMELVIVGRDLGDSGPRDERQFEYVISHNVVDIHKVALCLAKQLLPAEATRERAPSHN